MCEPISEFKHNYELHLRAIGKCDMHQVHDIEEHDFAATFAEAFKITRRFWTRNKGKRIIVRLEIDPAATDHLKAAP